MYTYGGVGNGTPRAMANWTVNDMFTCCGLWQTQELRTKNAQERLQVQIKAHDVRIFQLDKQINDLTAQRNRAVASRDVAVAKRVTEQKYVLCKKREKYAAARALCERACDSIGEVESVKETVTVLSEVRSTFKNQKMDKLFSELGTVTDAFSDVQMDLKQSQSLLTMNVETGAPWASDPELLKELEELDSLIDAQHSTPSASPAASVGAPHPPAPDAPAAQPAGPTLEAPNQAQMHGDIKPNDSDDVVSLAYRAAGISI